MIFEDIIIYAEGHLYIYSLIYYNKYSL